MTYRGMSTASTGGNATGPTDAERVMEALTTEVKRLILSFPWHNYGFDEIEDVEYDDWAQALAEHIAQTIWIATEK